MSCVARTARRRRIMMGHDTRYKAQGALARAKAARSLKHKKTAKVASVTQA